MKNNSGGEGGFYSEGTTDPPGGEIQRDGNGNPTGVLFARPFPGLILSPLGKAPMLSVDDQKNSAVQFMRELNRFGITSVIDPGSVGVAFPNDYDVISVLAKQGKLSVRLAMYLLPQESGQELKDFETWFPKVPVGKDGKAPGILGAVEFHRTPLNKAQGFVIPIRLLFRVDSKTSEKVPKTGIHMIFTPGIISRLHPQTSA